MAKYEAILDRDGEVAALKVDGCAPLDVTDEQWKQLVADANLGAEVREQRASWEVNVGVPRMAPVVAALKELKTMAVVAAYDPTEPQTEFEKAWGDMMAELNAQTTCNGCGKLMLTENLNMADGCPCNSPRGINHGKVPVHTCTCVECDPAQTGSVRQVPHHKPQTWRDREPLL